jgi:hypothetical protein
MSLFELDLRSSDLDSGLDSGLESDFEKSETMSSKFIGTVLGLERAEKAAMWLLVSSTVDAPDDE